jgi:Domain of unknown function (DUF397)
MPNTRPMDVVWRVSSRSNGTACIEVAESEATILVRDTKNRGRGIIALPLTAWKDFIKTVQTDSTNLR